MTWLRPTFAQLCVCVSDCALLSKAVHTRNAMTYRKHFLWVAPLETPILSLEIWWWKWALIGIRCGIRVARVVCLCLIVPYCGPLPPIATHCIALIQCASVMMHSPVLGQTLHWTVLVIVSIASIVPIVSIDRQTNQEKIQKSLMYLLKSLQSLRIDR